MQEAAGAHLARARALEAAGQPDEALREYRKATEFDPSNRSVAARAGELDRELRERLEASRPRPPIEAMREQARRNSPGAGAQSDLEGAAQPALLEHQPARPAQLHRQLHRHQRHLRPRLPGPQRHGAAGRRDPRRGAAADHAVEPDLLQGAERAHDHHRHRQHRQAPAVRGAGHQDLLRLARRRHRAGAARQHRDPGAADGHPAAHRRQQDRQHHHRARLGAGGRDHRAGHQDQRQAAGRGDHRRADSRGQPRARQALRLEPDRLRPRRHLLARAGARRRRGGRGGRRHGALERRLAPGLQRQHHLHGRQRRRLLPGRAGRHRALPRERLADQDGGQAAAARHRRAEGHPQPRRGSAGAEHHLHAAGARAAPPPIRSPRSPTGRSA